MSVRFHHLHQVEQVNLGSAEKKFLFVAIQNSHRHDSDPRALSFAEKHLQTSQGSCADQSSGVCAPERPARSIPTLTKICRFVPPDRRIAPGPRPHTESPSFPPQPTQECR